MDRIKLKDKRGIYYCIDPRLELLSIIQILAGQLESNFSSYYQKSSYTNKILNDFNKYEKEPIINKYNEYIKKGYYISNNQMLSLKLDSFLDTKNNTDNNMKEFSILLKEFNNKIKFEEYFNNNSEYYINILKTNIEYTSNNNYYKQLQDYYNDDTLNLNIVFRPLMSDWGESIFEDNIINCICGINKIDKNKLIFVDDKNEMNLIFHECSHYYVSDEFKDNKFWIDTECLFKNIPTSSFAMQEYGFFNIYIEETIVRTINIYLINKYGYCTKEEENIYIKEEINRGFIYCDIIYKYLKENEFKDSINLFKKYLINEAKKLY